ncbi:NUDIX domain-containing protein [Leisingera sp. M523]|uniref:NUDIX domain-containing protein n=1 Tax=Leisingera sp. M523 TaxID=2867013 RepID=UPI002882F987|nr:NUDIX domain-containing protein [Leisingera sp. M523]
MARADEDFSGAKPALFLGQDVLGIQRDGKPDTPYPGFWDLPGDGREGGKSPEACALREAREEVGLMQRPDR